ncbi:MAG: hypothetical protein IT449_04920 [Phycisphaerales bacterium]|nr:hypothetical protein [Phycisphaerales bacterium]
MKGWNTRWIIGSVLGIQLCLPLSVRSQSCAHEESLYLGARDDAAAAYDRSRRAVVLFGGTYGSNTQNPEDTWQYDGSRWTNIALEGPPHRSSPVMAYDSDRRVVVLYGGHGGPLDRRTWEWDGQRWQSVRFEHSPDPNGGYSMAYDEARHQMVLFGVPEGYVNPQTWIWDGVDWTLVTSEGPSGRRGHSMDYDSRRQRIVLFGGTTEDYHYSDETWEWDGAVWRRLFAPGPHARAGHVLVHDRARGVTMLFGGHYYEGYLARYLNDTWEWDGHRWRQRHVDSHPSSGGWARAYDADRAVTVLTGGHDDENHPLGETWEWDGTSWRWRFTTIGPAPRDRYTSLTYDSWRRQTLYIRRTTSRPTEILGWDGEQWRLLTTGGPEYPSDRVSAFDSARGVVVVMTSATDGGTVDQTWEWEGQDWSLRATVGPPDRWRPTMAYDAARGETLLFGGINDSNEYLGDTWAWNGESWRLAAEDGPSPRSAPSMAYDAERQVVVLAGGAANNYNSDTVDTWEWNGFSWRQILTVGPETRWGHVMVFDPRSRRVLLFGGHTWRESDGYLDGLWSWNGRAWTRVAELLLKGRNTPTAAFDSDRNRLIIAGGHDLGGGFVDTWEVDVADWPEFVAAPVPSDLVEGATLTLSVEADPPDGNSFQWRRDGVPLADDDRVHGSHTAELSISSVDLGHAGEYDVLVNEGGCEIATGLARITVEEVGIRCDEVADFSATCFQDEIHVGLRLESPAHDGERVAFLVDGRRVRAKVRGGAAYKLLATSPGPHAVEVVDPQACGLAESFDCPP